MVEGSAEKFVYDKGVLYFKDKTNLPFIPKFKGKKLIIGRNHVFGHFKTQSTCDRIKEKFLLPKIRSDVDNFVKKCET